jgi:phosphosulfolactate synthase (CoM biosynthesis protein A)
LIRSATYEGGINVDTFSALAKKVEALGFDAIEVSGGMRGRLIRPEKVLGRNHK